jgi:hypothetical protein
MHKKFLFTVILTMIASNSNSQNYLINNVDFEIGKAGHSPQCTYDAGDYIDDDIADWMDGECHTIWSCNYDRSWPDWMDDDNCNSVLYSGMLPPPSRFVYLEETGDGNHDAIRIGLNSNLSNSSFYTFRIRYTAVQRKNGDATINAPLIFFNLSKLGQHWANNWGNVRIWYYMWPPNFNNVWTTHWIIVPPIPFLTDLHTLIISCENGAAYIDRAEFFKNCESPFLIQNQNFYVNEIPYKSDDVLKAGYYVGASQPPAGNVTVHSPGSMIFKAGHHIFLEPGFEVEAGGNFETILEPCNIGTLRIADNSMSEDSIGIYDDRVDTLDCGTDSLIIQGLDGDTVSYSFQWDFGNGVTSTDKIARIYYDSPGSYLVQMIITDTSNVTDTLTKIYIVPECAERLASKNNSLDKELRFFPNPTTGKLTIEIVFADEQQAELSIFDMIGKRVMLVHDGTVSNKKFEVDLSEKDLTHGIYNIRLSTKEGVINKKLVLVQ